MILDAIRKFRSALSVGTHAAAAGRVVDTLTGTAAGLIGGLAFAPLRVQPARDASRQ